MKKIEKNKLIKFVKKHPDATTFLIGAGLVAGGVATFPLMLAESSNVGLGVVAGGASGSGLGLMSVMTTKKLIKKLEKAI